nr:ulp1 protease family, C-terminal catalytic domain-containing protein [Tanacetum cinerariifolium]
NHSSHEVVAQMRPFIPKLKWRTSNNQVDCGVSAMIHMENYVGDAAKNWEFGLCEESDEQLSMLQRMRNNRDPPKQVKETDAANVVVGVNEVVDQVKEKRRRKK